MRKDFCILKILTKSCKSVFKEFQNGDMQIKSLREDRSNEHFLITWANFYFPVKSFNRAFPKVLVQS